MPARCALGCQRPGTFSFPSKDRYPEKFKAWVKVINGKLETPEDYDIYKYKRMCPIHFKKEDYNRNNRLNALAVPTLHLPAWCSPPVNLKENVPESRCIIQSSLIITSMPEPSSLRIINPDSFLPYSSNLEEKENIVQCSTSTHDDEQHDVTICDDDLNYTEEVVISDTTVAKEDPRNSSPVNRNTDHNYFWRPKPKKKRTMFKDLSSYMIKMSALTRQVRLLKQEILRLRKRSVLYKTKLMEAKNVIRQSQKHIKQITKQDFQFQIETFTVTRKRKSKKKELK